ncbi:LacI family DNA-binding transcriptional regulator [Dyadobacter pollutisoli]|uniref:LacI family DNA-binding transcriptional regulator n=1 Tax=Dyadobacter pollutisoli TaxID=2910158 RepID=A0A9E8SLT2_9BACT|nr:LacI family DNA-binding transcriptional regulator [Dyadobacter pollutisoli]WAC12539.1 LacI family DNA-binding transcriptional regulator [Dyadobacter pollutisoli]
MKKKATIVDIALRLGITPSAVSKALSGNTRISDETRSAVRAMAKELDYQPNIMASALRTGKSGLIGILVPGIQYGFFSTAIKGAEELLSDAGYNVIICQSRDSARHEKKQLEGLMRAKVEGVIASLGMETIDVEFYKALAKEVPLVMFDRVFESESICSVVIDDFIGAVKAVDHLVEMGYQRIAHMGGHSHILAFDRRIRGYKYALAKHNLPVNEDYIYECSPNKDEGVVAMERLFQLPEPPDAILAASDFLALGVVNYAKSHHLNVPEDLGVVGFSNEEFTRHLTPSLTSVDQFSESMGEVAAQLLLDQLSRARKGSSMVVQQRVLVPRLVIRESSFPKKREPVLAA